MEDKMKKFKLDKITVDLKTGIIDIIRKPEEQKSAEMSYEEFKAEALKHGFFTRKFQPKKSGIQANLSVWFEVFEPIDGNDTRYIADFPTFEQAKECAGVEYCVDMVVALQDDNGFSLLEDGDVLFVVQVYPEFKQYKHDMKPIIKID
jgi:hypothetical protein